MPKKTTKKQQSTSVPVDATVVETTANRCGDCTYFNYGGCKLDGSQSHRPTDDVCKSFTVELPPPVAVCSQCSRWHYGRCTYLGTGGHKSTEPACSAFCPREDVVSTDLCTDKPASKGRKKPK